MAVKVVDFESSASLIEAIKGNDAVIDATSTRDPSIPIRLMDAAAVAGVYRFIPGEFSNDPKNKATQSLPVFQPKAQAFRHLEKLASENKLTFTAISTGAFLDWGLKNGFLGIDLANKKIDLMNDGGHVFPWTCLSAVGKAVANALLLPEETKNRICFIHSLQTSQKEVATLAKEALGVDGWQTQRLDMSKIFDDAMAAVKAGDFSWNVMAGFLRYSISTPGYTGPVGNDDNKLLGIEPLTDEEVKQLIKAIAG